MAMKNRKLAFAAALIAAVSFAAPAALAQSTPFLTEKGTINFPFLPPASQGGPYRLNNVSINATTPQAGSFTTLSATGAVTGAGFTARLASPGPIGSTAASSVAATTLAASGAVSGAGFTALFASPPALGGTAPAAGAHTTLRTTGLVTVTQGDPVAATVSATLTAANLINGIITVNQGGAAASAQQLPAATAMDSALPASVAGDAFDFSVINISTTAAEAASVTTNSGWTLVGDMDVAANSAVTTKSAGRFRARKTGTGTWVLYRLS
jgi:hypothetical protein